VMQFGWVRTVFLTGLIICTAAICDLSVSYGGYYGSSNKSSASGSPKPKGPVSLSANDAKKALLKAAQALDNGWRCPECVVTLRDAGAPDNVIDMVKSDLENGRVNQALAAELARTANAA